MKMSDYIAEYLYAQGVREVFELVGGMITHLVDSIHRNGKLQLISVHHEQAAAFAAEAAGRMTGVPGVALATSGPGATNLLTGIGSCYFDSTPAVFITGQVNRDELRGNRPIRQLGFQETDIVTMAKPITKAAMQAASAAELPDLLAEAFRLAVSGRPGPVLLDIPMDLQRAEINAPLPPRFLPDEGPAVEPAAVAQLLADLRRAERPLILVGGGVRSAQAVDLLRSFVDAAHTPVVNSLMGVDVLPYDHPLRVGLIGSYGNRWANLAIGRADFLVVLGSRLDIRQTGADTEAFRQGRTIYHVDCEVGEINNRVLGSHAIVADLKPFLREALAQAQAAALPVRTEWESEITALRSQWPDTAELNDVGGINPNAFLHQLSAVSRRAAAFVVDVGQHQMWAAQSLDPAADQRFFTSGGMGAMGFALPAAVGASIAANKAPIILVAGDGGFQVNLQELQTVARNRLPLKMVILNNHCHGMVRQFQQSYFDERYQSTYWGYSAPDFVQVARAFGIAAGQVTDPAEVGAALDELWADPNAPYLLEVGIDTFANAYPKIAFGRPMTEMEPFAQPIAMEGT